MSRRLPQRINPWSVAEGQEHLRGTVDVSEMTRLCAELIDADGVVQVELRGAGRILGWDVLEGRAIADVRLECQRCLGPVAVQLRPTFRLALVEQESSLRELPDDLEPLVVEPHEGCRLADLVEDELLLALPIAPRHELSACGSGEQTTRGAPEGRRPLSGLGDLWARAKEQE